MSITTHDQSAKQYVGAVFPLHLKQQLKEKAERNDRSFAAELRRAAEHYLHDNNEAA